MTPRASATSVRRDSPTPTRVGHHERDVVTDCMPIEIREANARLASSSGPRSDFESPNENDNYATATRSS